MTIEAFLSLLEFPSDQKQTVLQYFPFVGDKIAPFSHAYMREGKTMDECLAAVRALDLGELHQMSRDLVFCLQAALYLYEDYRKAGLSDLLFINTMQDIKYKVNECMNCHGRIGLVRVEWFDGYFRLARFAFGRLQFDLKQFPLPDVKLNDHLIREGEFCLFCHIPSSGPLPYELCLDSYRQAYAFVKKDVQADGILPILCHSWFLYPDYRPLFAGTNIGRFAADYTLLRRDDTEAFNDAWRVFSRDLSCGTAALPCNTTLQKRFIDYIDKGGRFGVGLGAFLFDGIKIL